jgi:hypothetical protein
MINLSHERLPEWESPDASAFREFLETPTGKKLFPLLLAERPAMTGSQTLEVAGLTGKTIEGFDLCINALSELCSTQNKTQKPAPSPYPDLTNDDEWEGPKLRE